VLGEEAHFAEGLGQQRTDLVGRELAHVVRVAHRIAVRVRRRDGQHAARREHARELAQHGAGVRDVLDHLEAGDQVEGPVLL
jgi:hypothetical protein